MGLGPIKDCIYNFPMSWGNSGYFRLSGRRRFGGPFSGTGYRCRISRHRRSSCHRCRISSHWRSSGHPCRISGHLWSFDQIFWRHPSKNKHRPVPDTLWYFWEDFWSSEDTSIDRGIFVRISGHCNYIALYCMLLALAMYRKMPLYFITLPTQTQFGHIFVK